MPMREGFYEATIHQLELWESQLRLCPSPVTLLSPWFAHYQMCCSCFRPLAGHRGGEHRGIHRWLRRLFGAQCFFNHFG